jgi:hypothetical protein
MKKLYYTTTFLLLTVTIIIMVLFPGQQKSIAFTLATGIGIPTLQAKVDLLEDKAINKEKFKEEEILFLRDLFRTMSTGAKYSLLLTESGKLTSHYLNKSGEDYILPNYLFVDNKRVKKQMEILKNKLFSDIENGAIKEFYVSKRFYMPHKSVPDSIYALYYGNIYLHPTVDTGGAITLTWRAELPWHWPKYDYLKEKFDNYRAHRFSIPNLSSIFVDKKSRLKVDDGLGEYLVTLGIARPFLAYSSWQENILNI